MIYSLSISININPHPFSAESRIESPVEHVDIFPTLVDLARLPQLDDCPESIETNEINLCAEGKSLASLISAIDMGGVALSNDSCALVQTLRSDYKAMGYSIYTNSYRYKIKTTLPFNQIEGIFFSSDTPNGSSWEVLAQIPCPNLTKLLLRNSMTSFKIQMKQSISAMRKIWIWSLKN